MYLAKVMLHLLGYEINDRSYEMDETTVSSLAKFEEENGLFSDGTLDFETQKVLNSKYEEFCIQEDNQLNRAKEYINSL